MLDDFAVFILTHGRPDNVKTYSTLKRQGYTGRVYIIIDNEDKTAQQYYDLYGDKVIMFYKAAIAETFDEGDNFQDRRAVIYARNACWGIAEKLGIKWFLQLDDDYTRFDYRFDSSYQVIQELVRNLDNVFYLILNYYKSINAKAMALSQSGDFIGWDKLKTVCTFRKCMNTFFCSTDRPFQFVGRVNEDVNTYVWYQGLGNLFLSFNNVSITQAETQSNTGGMTDLYKDSGTYIKSFYTVMYAPSCTKIGLMQSEHKRLHHFVKWDNAVPCILNEKYRHIGST